MGKLHWPGGALTAPVPPALVTCGSLEGGDANVLTIAWTGIINTVPPKTYISVRPKRHSYEILKRHMEFTVNLPTVSLIRAIDSCGVYTGAKMNKFERFGLTPESGSVVSAPVIAECPLSLECRITDVIPLGSHDMFLADIVAVDVDESLVDDTGKLHLDRAGLVAFAHGEYFELGRKLGTFGYSVRKKKKKR
ncbi:MAG: flavin reductase family protein [Clostridia bacterium]|nr:flavin reductase family protein [Clostridia bacterium]MBR2908497.1 flavin reductase family protein [Clostridia bacterium]